MVFRYTFCVRTKMPTWLKETETLRKYTDIILTPFYTVKLDFTVVFISFLISAQNIDGAC